jgi:hypothetical protein
MTQVVDKIYKKKISTEVLPSHLSLLSPEGSVLPHKMTKKYRYTSNRDKDSPVKVKSYSQYKT